MQSCLIDVTSVLNNARLISSGQVYVPLTARYSVNSLLRTPISVTENKTSATVTLLDATTDQAAILFWKSGFKPCLLNFANAEHTGGAYIRGGKGSQEEELMRVAPALYTSLHLVQYPFNNYEELLYTENIQIMKQYNAKKKIYELLPEQDQAIVSVVSAAAPDLRFFRQTFDRDSMSKLINSIIRVPLLAECKQPRSNTLILGSIGNGAFKNDPEITATIFAEVLTNYLPFYDQIVFAIPDRKSKNYKVYEQILGSHL